MKHTQELNKCLYKLDNEQVERLFKENSEIVKESIGYFNYSEELLRKILDNINFPKLENRPEFTREQEDWICYQIGEWYLEWKDNIVAGAAFHKLGIAKEHLKNILCDKMDVEPKENER